MLWKEELHLVNQSDADGFQTETEDESCAEKIRKAKTTENVEGENADMENSSCDTEKGEKEKSNRQVSDNVDTVEREQRKNGNAMDYEDADNEETETEARNFCRDILYFNGHFNCRCDRLSNAMAVK